jgi:hypothetical protein
VIDELSGHCGLPSLKISGKFGADVTMPAAKGKRSSPLASRLREAGTSLPDQITSIFRNSPQPFGNYRADFIAG